MSYLEEFKFLLEDSKTADFLHLWEEYCMTDEVDAKELNEVLKLIKDSTVATTFGQFADTILPLWKKITDPTLAGETLRYILDLQTSNNQLFADLAIDFLKNKYSESDHYNEKMRIVGLLTRRSFQGAISGFELLTHMKKGSFVFHTGGWGVGEVMDISLIREHVVLEFEGISARKDLAFNNALKNLSPLSSDHFLARRFGAADALEKEGKEDPAALIRLLLRDLGPKTAQEIKEELCELVIPEADWAKWWGTARTKIKKDTKIQSPKTAKEHFHLRTEDVSHEHRFKEALEESKGVDAATLVIYNFTRDFPEVAKNQELKQQFKAKLLDALEPDPKLPDLSVARQLQALYLLEDFFPEEYAHAAARVVKELKNVELTLNLIEIMAFKKRTLMTIRANREDWGTLFLQLLFSVYYNPIRDYLFRELEADSTTKILLKEKIHKLLNTMTLYPEAFFWYFQKVVEGEDVPYNDEESKHQFLEAYLILLHFIEDKPEMRELVKKMLQYLTNKRYGVVRQLIEGASVVFLQEFLLLVTKCQSFTKQDIRILHNLAEVVRPELAKKKEKGEELEIIWTTQAGYQKLQERIHQIGTVETLDNAKEIETARAHGDLRENAEYKFALERRSRLQTELGALVHQLNKARILTKADITPDTICVGSVVDLLDSKGNKVTYTLLGPLEADPDQHILSFQSKLAQAMMGYKKGETFDFQGEKYTVKGTKSFLT